MFSLGVDKTIIINWSATGALSHSTYQTTMKQVEFFVGGLKLRGTLILPPTLRKKNPAILFIHGWTSNKERNYQYGNGLAKLGYICFAFDLRGHGESEGNIETTATKEFLDDVIAAFDYLTNVKGVDKENINVVTSSFGGYLGSLLTTKRSVKHLVLRVPADYPNEVFNKSKMQTSGADNPSVMEWRRKQRAPKETFALDAIAHFGGNILIIESEKDTVIPHQIIENYVNAVKDKTKLTAYGIAKRTS